jgi:hypothetical protein
MSQKQVAFALPATDDDDAPLLSASPVSSSGSIQQHLPDVVVPEDVEEQKGPTASKKDIFLMVWINFLSFICFAIVLPSLWPYLKSVRISFAFSLSASSFTLNPVSPIKVNGRLGCGC